MPKGCPGQKKPHVSEAMKARWDDPYWAARQAARISKGHLGKGRAKGRLIYVTAGLDRDLYIRLRTKAMRDGTSLANLCRTYLEWGLEEDEQTTT